MNRTTKIAHLVTVALMAVAVLVATGDGFAQSYAGLLKWAAEHHLHTWRADSFPLLVDLFILVGELGLFALALEGHRLTRSALSWTDLALPGGIAAAGWIVSLLFNVGAARHEWADQVTAAVPPVAAMLGLLVLLRTLHRLVRTVAPSVAAEATVEALPEPVPGTALELAPADHGFDGLDEAGRAGQGPGPGLVSAVRSAHAAGWTKAAIGEEFGLTRYRVNRLLDDPYFDDPATLNGHQLATADYAGDAE